MCLQERWEWHWEFFVYLFVLWMMRMRISGEWHGQGERDGEDKVWRVSVRVVASGEDGGFVSIGVPNAARASVWASVLG